jgi:hypothetical protein
MYNIKIDLSAEYIQSVPEDTDPDSVQDVEDYIEQVKSLFDVPDVSVEQINVDVDIPDELTDSE